MFTGIVEEVGAPSAPWSPAAPGGAVTIAARRVLEGTGLGDSIAVNGVCLTVTRLLPDGFTADVMAETLRRSNLGRLQRGETVNLERALAADGRFGGHIVTGHVDNLVEIVQIKQEGAAKWVTLSAAPENLELIVEKGSRDPGRGEPHRGRPDGGHLQRVPDPHHPGGHYPAAP